MKLKKVFSMLTLMAVLASFVVGCTNQNKLSEKEDPNTVPEKPYEITWYMSGQPQSDVSSVEMAVNEYLKDKINATIKIYRLDSAQYSKKMSTMISAAESFDICFCSSDVLSYKTNAQNGAFFPLDEYIDDYMPKLKGMMEDYMWDCAKVNGKIYALPTYKETAGTIGFIYRKDIADKYNIDMDSIKSFEELEPYLKLIKENEPDMQYPIDWDSSRTPASAYQYDGIASQAVLYRNGPYPEDTVINRIETPEFIEGCRLARKFYEEGLVKPDVLTASDLYQRMKEGKTFCHLEYLRPCAANDTYKNVPFPVAQSDITEATHPILPSSKSMNAISATSKNPTRAMRFLDLFNSDPYLYNLIVFGIEGKHYTKNDDGTINIVPNSTYSMSGSQWMLGNIYQSYQTPEEDQDKFDKILESQKTAKKPIFMYFNFDNTSVQNEIAACSSVQQQYYKQIVLGAVDPDSIYNEYLSAMKAAGLDKIVEEAKRQYDTYLKENNYK